MRLHIYLNESSLGGGTVEKQEIGSNISGKVLKENYITVIE